MRVLALTPVPEDGASARFRVYQYVPGLEAQGFQVTVSPFYTPPFFRILYDEGRYLRKAVFFAARLFAQARVLARRLDYDLFLVHREVLPVGPPVVEMALARVPGRALVYDFDDAIYLPNVSAANRYVGPLKWFRKIPQIIQASHLVIAGNQYLAQYASAHNESVTVMPTCVDTTKFVPREKARVKGADLVVGWIGSPTTTRYVLALQDVLRRVAGLHRFTLRLSGVGRAIGMPGVTTVHEPWSLAREVSLFNTCDVGIYPLPDDPWTRGKCGFKAIQFMACGVPVVAAAMGVNRQIIQDGVNGFLAASEAEWMEKLERLLADARLRDTLGQAGRRTVEERYSLHVQAPRLAAVLRSAASQA